MAGEGERDWSDEEARVEEGEVESEMMETLGLRVGDCCWLW